MRAKLQSVSVAVFVVVLAAASSALAVPAFARQTGLACSSCHTIYPELTPFGRQFKANGYTMTMTKQVTSVNAAENRTFLEFPAYVPLGMQIQSTFTHTQAAQPSAGTGNAPSAKNNDVVLPDQWSFFYAGKVAPYVGAFMQLTYTSVDNHFGFDNTDIRFANHVAVGEKNLVYGVSVNNNPSVTDLWNSTPAWNAAPAISSSVAPTPAAMPLVQGGLATQVAGVGAYAWYDGFLYAEVDAYRSAPLGVARPFDAATGATNIVNNLVPYWRVALEKDWGNQSIMVGTYGMYASIWPGGTNPNTTPPSSYALTGSTNQYLDLAADAQYQYIGDKHTVTAVAAYVHESQTLDAAVAQGAAANTSNTLNYLNVSAEYLWDRTIGIRGIYTSTWGNSDTGLYAPASLTGSANGSPGSHWITTELTYNPWYNTKLGLQYVAYLDFNGGSTNYDGSGRNASDNNTLFAYLWLAF
jgi:hypothetical protein